MPVSNCFFQIAFVRSADSILVILTLQTVLSLAYSANLPKQFEGLYTWSVLVFDQILSFIHKAFWNYFSVASRHFIFYVLVCELRVLKLFYIYARWKYSVCQFTSESSCILFSFCSLVVPHSFGQIYAAPFPGGTSSYVLCWLLIFSSPCPQPTKLNKLLFPLSLSFLSLKLRLLYFHSSFIPLFANSYFRYVLIEREKVFLVHLYICYVCIYRYIYSLLEEHFLITWTILVYVKHTVLAVGSAASPFSAGFVGVLVK